MKRSTCEYFQRENELSAIRNSARRVATSAGRLSPAIASAVAAIDTACASWA
jgi:hypothetical protein